MKQYVVIMPEVITNIIIRVDGWIINTPPLETYYTHKDFVTQMGPLRFISRSSRNLPDQKLDKGSFYESTDANQPASKSYYIATEGDTALIADFECDQLISNMDAKRDEQSTAEEVKILTLDSGQPHPCGQKRPSSQRRMSPAGLFLSPFLRNAPRPPNAASSSAADSSAASSSAASSSAATDRLPLLGGPQV